MERNYIKYIQPYLKELKPLNPLATGIEAQLGEGDFKAIIFDIYGTLLISASGDVDKAEYSTAMIRNALIAASFKILNDSDEAFDTIYQIFNKCVEEHQNKGKEEGKPSPEIDILKVSEDTLRTAESMGLISFTKYSDVILFNFVFELQSNKVWPMPGMQDVIKLLGDSKLSLGIVSNAQFYTPVIMNYILYDSIKDSEEIKPFDNELIVYSFKELRGKPDVELFEPLLKGLKQKGIKPEEALFVGNDMLKDVYTASKAGLKTVLFAGDERSYRPRRDDERCKDIKADYVITELVQLLEIINI